MALGCVCARCVRRGWPVCDRVSERIDKKRM